MDFKVFMIVLLLAAYLFCKRHSFWMHISALVTFSLVYKFMEACGYDVGVQKIY